MSKKVTKIISTILTAIFVFAMFSTNVESTALGINPQYITINNALRGGEYTKNINIFNQGDEDEKVSLSSSGDISTWTFFYDKDNLNETINNITLPANSIKQVLVIFKIPKNIPNGIYIGKILVKTIPLDTSEKNLTVTVPLSLPIFTTINVTGEQILNGTVEEITIEDAEINYPTRIKIDFLNTGNVIAQPEIKINIFTASGLLIENFTYKKDNIEINKSKTIEIKWNTTGKAPGEYIANITVFLGGKVIRSQNLSFQILPYGTLSRSGYMTNLTYQGVPQKGNLIRIIAVFFNTGEIDTKAKFIGEVYIDGSLSEIIESEEVVVEKYKKKAITAYLEIKKDGEYVINGYILFEGKTTNITKISFTVGNSLSLQIILLLTGLGLATVIFFVIWKKKPLKFNKFIKNIRKNRKQ